MNFFVTGTDTNAGKTFVTALLTKSLRQAGFDTVAMKPVSCGDPGDTLLLRAAGDNELTFDEVTPISYKAPVAPIEAARQERRTFDPAEALRVFKRLHKTHTSILVEGVGGWLVPLSKNYSSADLANAIGLPILLVARNRLGAINHTLLTLESIQAHGLVCGGIILNNHPLDSNDIAAAGNRLILEQLTQVPILFEISPGQSELELAVA